MGSKVKRISGNTNNIMFISFACPKETNQRKRQPQIFFGLTAILVRISINKKIRINIWVSNGLREFWEIATVMRLAARALSKQYCLSEQRERVVLRAQAEKQPPQNSLQP